MFANTSNVSDDANDEIENGEQLIIEENNIATTSDLQDIDENAQPSPDDQIDIEDEPSADEYIDYDAEPSADEEIDFSEE